jgi:hypothetical protein
MNKMIPLLDFPPRTGDAQGHVTDCLYGPERDHPFLNLFIFPPGSHNLRAVMRIKPTIPDIPRSPYYVLRFHNTHANPVKYFITVS